MAMPLLFEIRLVSGPIMIALKVAQRASFATDWSNPQDIHISISVVYAISEKHDAVNGVRVTYDIGTVISRDCDLGNPL
jgi:hypothetical protein